MIDSPHCILHLADPGWPGGGPCALRMLGQVMTRLSHDRHVVIVLGSAADRELARVCGVPSVGHVPLPAGQALLGRRAMARAVDALAAGNDAFTVVHAWSARAAVVGQALCRRSAPRQVAGVASLNVGPVDGLHTELLGAGLAAESMPLLTPTVSVRREFLAAGVAPSLVPVLPPGVTAPVPPSRRGQLRRRWGVSDRTFVMGLVGDPIDWSDARGAVFVMTLLRVAGHDAHLVLHPSARRAEHMARWAAPLEIDGAVSLDPLIAQPWRVAEGLDVALHMGDEATAIDPQPLGSVSALLFGGGRPRRPMPGVLPLLWTAAAGVPSIAEASLAACGVIEEGTSGLLVEPRDVAATARRLLSMIEEPQVRNRIGVAARERVLRTNAPSAMCVRMRQVYDAVCAGTLPPVPLYGLDADDEEAVRWRPRADGDSTDVAASRRRGAAVTRS